MEHCEREGIEGVGQAGLLLGSPATNPAAEKAESSSMCHGNAAGIARIMEFFFFWKKALKAVYSIHFPALTCVPKCHILKVFKSLQGWSSPCHEESSPNT